MSPAPHRVAPRLLDDRGAFEAVCLEGGDEGVAAQFLPRRHGVAEVRDIVRDGGHLLEGAPGGHHDARLSREQRGDGLDAFAFGLGVIVRFLAGGATLPLGEVHREAGAEQGLEVAQVLAGPGGRGRGEDPEAVGEVSGQGGEGRQVQGAGRAPGGDGAAGPRQAMEERAEGGRARDGGGGGVGGGATHRPEAGI